MIRLAGPCGWLKKTFSAPTPVPLAMRHSAGCVLAPLSRCAWHSEPGLVTRLSEEHWADNLSLDPPRDWGTAIHKILVQRQTIRKRWQGSCPVAPGIVITLVPCWASKLDDEEGGTMLEERPSERASRLTSENRKKAGTGTPIRYPATCEAGAV